MYIGNPELLKHDYEKHGSLLVEATMRNVQYSRHHSPRHQAHPCGHLRADRHDG